jgi:cytochrome c-type protein NapC
MGVLNILLVGVAVSAILLLLAVGRRPEQLIADARGRLLGLIAFVVLPGVFFVGGLDAHIERSKETTFCLSCHSMEPYGESLHVDDSELVAAAHYQNGRIPREQACYTCHTTYTMYGPVKSKLAGLGHIWRYYVAGYPEKLELREPYQNRECLHCHSGSRSFEESDAHADDLAALHANETSCLECHSDIHAIDKLAEAPRWKEGRP